MTVYGYCRVSTVRQASEGDSLELQRRQIEGYAMMKGLVVDRVFSDEGVSGSTPLFDRPRGAELFDGLGRGDVVITSKLDRMFRSASDALDTLADLKRRGVALHMIDLGGDVCANGISKLVFTILSAVAESVRDGIRERVAQSKADQKKQGRYLGGHVPFGFRRGETKAEPLIPVAEEQAAIAIIREEKAAGKSLREISAMARDAGFRISHEGVRRVLAAPL